MTQNLATYIALHGTTGEAMEHWHGVFGGELQILRYGDMQLEGMPFTPPPNAVAHATLTLPAGTIAGGAFLKHFVPDDIPWAHLDIAGTAYLEAAQSHGAPGATLVCARLLADWAARSTEGK